MAVAVYIAVIMTHLQWVPPSVIGIDHHILFLITDFFRQEVDAAENAIESFMTEYQHLVRGRGTPFQNGLTEVDTVRAVTRITYDSLVWLMRGGSMNGRTLWNATRKE